MVKSQIQLRSQQDKKKPENQAKKTKEKPSSSHSRARSGAATAKAVKKTSKKASNSASVAKKATATVGKKTKKTSAKIVGKKQKKGKFTIDPGFDCTRDLLLKSDQAQSVPDRHITIMNRNKFNLNNSLLVVVLVDHSSSSEEEPTVHVKKASSQRSKKPTRSVSRATPDHSSLGRQTRTAQKASGKVVKVLDHHHELIIFSNIFTRPLSRN